MATAPARASIHPPIPPNSHFLSGLRAFAPSCCIARFPPAPTGKLRAAMAYVRTRLGRWFYEERGTAKRAGDPPIVLLHGLLFDGGAWRKQVEPLAALGRVIVIDGPG